MKTIGIGIGVAIGLVFWPVLAVVVVIVLLAVLRVHTLAQVGRINTEAFRVGAAPYPNGQTITDPLLQVKSSPRKGLDNRLLRNCR